MDLTTGEKLMSYFSCEGCSYRGMEERYFGASTSKYRFLYEGTYYERLALNKFDN